MFFVCSLIRIVDVNKNILEKHIPYSKECTLNTEEVIQQNGDLFSTNTMLFRAQYVENLPSFYMNAHVGDYPLTIIFHYAVKYIIPEDDVCI